MERSTRQCRDQRVEVEIDGSKWHINASMSRSTRRCRDRWIEVAHQRVNVEINASMSRSMDRSGTSKRQCRDQRVDVEFDGSISCWSNLSKRSCFKNRRSLSRDAICWPKFPQLIDNA